MEPPRIPESGAMMLAVSAEPTGRQIVCLRVDVHLHAAGSGDVDEGIQHRAMYAGRYFLFYGVQRCLSEHRQRAHVAVDLAIHGLQCEETEIHRSGDVEPAAAGAYCFLQELCDELVTAGHEGVQFRSMDAPSIR